MRAGDMYVQSFAIITDVNYLNLYIFFQWKFCIIFLSGVPIKITAYFSHARNPVALKCLVRKFSPIYTHPFYRKFSFFILLMLFTYHLYPIIVLLGRLRI